MSHNKKGFVFAWGLTIVAFVILVIAYVSLSAKYSNLPYYEELGGKQEHLIQTYQQGEFIRAYVDQAAKFSTDQAMYDLGQSGWYAGDFPCGDYFGFSLWSDQDKQCFPEVGTELGKAINMNLNRYLKEYQVVPNNNFIISVQDESIVGIAKQKVVISADGNGQVTYSSNIGVQAADGSTKTLEPTTGDPDCPGVSDFVDLDSFISCDKDVNCKLTKEAAQALQKAVEIAESNGYEIQVVEAYRSYAEQKYLWEHGTSSHPEWAYNSAKIARPSCSSPHVQGGAVDVQLKEVDMGSEPSWDMNNANRQKLESIMNDAGFVRYGDIALKKGEWWHYEYGTDRWRRGKEAGVGAIV